MIAIDQLHPSGLNPRKTFDTPEMAELVQSIRAKGLVQPIIARPDRTRGGFEIVAGERRWRAAQKAPLHTVPVIVRELSDQDVAEFAVIENVQRQDLNAIEEAAGYNELIVRFNYTQEEVAEVVGKSRSYLANSVRLLKLPPKVQDLVRLGRLTAGAARAIVGQANSEVLAEQIIANGLNVREIEAIVADADKAARAADMAATLGAGSGTASSGGAIAGGSRAIHPSDKDADTRAFEKDLSDALGLKVEIKPGSGESGQLTIRYGNFDQLDYIKMRLIGGATY